MKRGSISSDDDRQVLIWRRPTPAGRHTYWMLHPDTADLVRVRRVVALKMVAIGTARFALLKGRDA